LRHTLAYPLVNINVLNMFPGSQKGIPNASFYK
jgi:hypothetical protein